MKRGGRGRHSNVVPLPPASLFRRFADTNVYGTGYVKMWQNSPQNVRVYTDIFLQCTENFVQLAGLHFSWSISRLGIGSSGVGWNLTALYQNDCKHRTETLERCNGLFIYQSSHLILTSFSYLPVAFVEWAIHNRSHCGHSATRTSWLWLRPSHRAQFRLKLSSNDDRETTDRVSTSDLWILTWPRSSFLEELWSWLIHTHIKVKGHSVQKF